MVGLTSVGGDVKIYTVNGGADQVPDFLQKQASRKSKGKQKQSDDVSGISLLQDFDFPEASARIKSSRDGKYLLATGTYKPRMKVFQLDELGMKFERTTNAANVDFQILSDDWTKTIHLQDDRSVELHNQAFAFYKTRIPRAGRAIAYHFPSCDALIGGLGGQVYRLNLEQGRFMIPLTMQGNQEEGSSNLPSTSEDIVLGVNAIDLNPAHQLISLGTETILGQGTVEFWDHRSRKKIGILSLPYNKLSSSTSSAAARLPGLADLHPSDTSLTKSEVAVTALASRSDGLNIAVGTSTGHTMLYDLRTTRPYLIKDQGYGLPIKKIEWPQLSTTDSSRESPLIATADSKVVKIWSSSVSENGKNLVSINPPSDINDMHIYPQSGLVCLANEQPAMTAYYVPSLGQAPRWCRFLDNMTEEMEDNTLGAVYEDFKFVDRKEVESLNLEHLIGTESLRPYMHGFIMDLPVYMRARAVAKPFEYAEHRQKLIAEKLEKERESRIRSKGGLKAGPLPGNSRTLATGEKITVNKDLADKLALEPDVSIHKKRKRDTESGTLLADDRFGNLFTNPDFAIDKKSKEYAMVNPSAAAKAKIAKKEADEEGSSEGEAVDETRVDVSNSDSDSRSEDDLIPFDKPAKQKKRDVQPIRSANGPSLQPSNASLYNKTRSLGELNPRNGRTSKRSQQSSKSSQQESIRQVEGGMEMSFLPSISGKEKSKSGSKKPKPREELGVGMQKGLSEEQAIDLEGEQRSGRSARRKIDRSASKGAMRKHRPDMQRRQR